MMPTTNNKRSKTSNDDSSDTNSTQNMVLVPTCPNKENTEELDLQSMTEEELKLLQTKGKQSRLVAAVPISFLNSEDYPFSQSCSFLPAFLLMKLMVRYYPTNYKSYTAMPPSNVSASWHHTATVAVAPSSLDDSLRGVHHRYPFGFTISIPNSNEHEHKLSLPAAMASEYEQKNEGEGSCDESASLVSELTQMTYRAELKKQAIMIEFEKFRQQKKQQGVEAHPEVIKAMFYQTMSCPDTLKRMTSFVNSTSVKMKAEARLHLLSEEVQEEEDCDATSDPTKQGRVDELFVEFGVRPARPIPYEISEENAMRSRPSTDQGAATDHHLDSVIQLKVQLAQKQATLDELSSKYNALLVQKSAHQHNMLAKNSRLVRENERVVPTFTNKENTEELDVQSMTEEELKLLQKKDPFLYYSIPAVREAELSLKEVDYSEISQSARNVTRKTRVSFENHTNLLIDELLVGNEGDGLEESDLGELDDLLTMLFFDTQ